MFKKIVLGAVGGLLPLSFAVTPALASPQGKATQIVINHYKTIKENGVVLNGTTYMPIYYLMQALNVIGFQSQWDGSNWHISGPSFQRVQILRISLLKRIGLIYTILTLVLAT